MEDRLLGLTKKDICSLAYELAERNGIAHRFSKDKKAAGNAWFSDFLRRNPELSFRTPEATSAARARGFNKEAVAKFFTLFEEIITKNGITDPSKVYNMDESNIQTVPSKLSKIIAHKGRKQVGALTSAERGESVTITFCVNAAGQFIPPQMIFPRKRRNELYFKGAPYGTLCLQNQTGYQNSETFVQFLKHFQEHTHCSVDNKVILLLDGHSSHKSLAAVEFCRANGIMLLSFPPHCTHEMQPMDVGIFGPFQGYYNQELHLWLKSNPGRIVTLYDIASIFGKAYRRTATMHNGLSAFEKTGIWPFNPNIFPDWRFKPSLTTERPLVTAENDVLQNEGASFVHEKPPDLEKTTNCSTASRNSIAAASRLSPKPSCSTENVSFKKRDKHSDKYSSSSESEDDWQPSGRSSDEVSIFPEVDSEIEQKDSDQSDSEVTDRKRCDNQASKIANESSPKKFISPFDFSPPPVAPSNTRRSRPSQGATVLTSTPNYNITKEKTKAQVKPKHCAKKKVTKSLKFTEKSKKSKENIEDAPCAFCGELFSQSKPKERWIRCMVCQQWAHTLCAGVLDRSNTFICDLCK